MNDCVEGESGVRVAVLVDRLTTDVLYAADGRTYLLKGKSFWLDIKKDELVILEATNSLCPCCKYTMWGVVK